MTDENKPPTSILDRVGKKKARARKKQGSADVHDINEGKLFGGAVNGDSHVDFARLFVDKYPDMRFVAKWGKWMHWTGNVWREDETLITTRRARDLLADFAGRFSDTDLTRRRWLSFGNINAVDLLARCDERVSVDWSIWDKDKEVINTPGGLVSLRDGSVEPNSPSQHCAKITNVAAIEPDYDDVSAPDYQCPLWLKFLDSVTRGDQDLIGFLRRSAGYSLTGSTDEQCLFFYHGFGANGKSVYLRVLEHIMGDYATTAQMDTFADSSQDRHPTDVAALVGKRAVIAQETEEGRKWAEARIKTMTGGDVISARFMRQDLFSFTPEFKLHIAGNHKPTLRNVDEATKRRFLMIPFTVTIPAEKRDKDLFKKLMCEGEGILGWAITGAMEYFECGLKPPAAVMDATNEYFSEEDLLGTWVKDECDVDREYWEPTGRLYEGFRRYMDKSGLRPPSKQVFSARMKAIGFEPGNTKTRGGRHWCGLRLKLEAQP